jgi:hypothetical protein
MQNNFAAPPKNRRASYTLQLVEGLPDKARIYVGTGIVQVDRAQWAEWSPLQRLAILNHELAHDENPAWTESETDRRAGARLRHEGIPLVDAARALASVVESRQTVANVAAGWHDANRHIVEYSGRHPARLMSKRPQGIRSAETIDFSDDPMIIEGRAPRKPGSALPLVALVAIVLVVVAVKG